jgi:hypothetical protein
VGNLLNTKKKLVVGLVLITFTLSLLTGCSSGGSSGDTSLFTIQGTINDTNENPVSGAKISVGNKTTESNSKGVWQIKDLKSGKYTVKVNLSGYANYSKEISVSSNSTYDIKMSKVITLSITSEGQGEVLKEPEKDGYTMNEKVKLTAKPSSGWIFSKWTGDIEKSENPYTITLDSDKSINVVFTEEDSSTNHSPILDSIGDKNVEEGSELKFTATASDADGDEINLSATDLPTGANFDSSTGEFSWTPASNQIGSFTIVFIASDGKLEAKENVTIDVIDSNQAPTIETISDKRVVIENLLSFTVNANDPDGDILNLSATNLPNGASFDAATGQFNWTPSIEQAGNYEVEFIADDGDLTNSILINILAGYSLNIKTRGITGVETGSITITPDEKVYAPNAEVILEAIPDDGYSFSGWEGPFFSLRNPIDIVMDSNKELTAVFGDGMILNIVESAYGSVAKNPDESVYTSGAIIELTATPHSGYVFDHWEASRVEGNEIIEVYVNDNIEDFNLHNTKNPLNIILRYSDINIEPIFIDENTTPTNQAPVLNTIGSKSIYEGNNLSFTVNADDPDGDTVTLSASSLPYGASFDSATGKFSWTPNTEQAGNYDVTFTASDGKLEDSEIITVTVENTNQMPVLNSIGNKTVEEGSELLFKVTASDPDGDKITLSASGLPTGANFDASTGDFSWIPTSEDIGNYGLTFIANDENGGTDEEAISINVTKINTNPVANDVNFTIDEDTSKTFYESDILANDTDADGDTLTILDFTYPKNGTYNENSDGSITYTPNPDYYGEEIVTYTISDGNGGTDTAIVTITINSVNDAPIINYIEDKNVVVSDKLTFTVNANDVDGDDVSYSASGLPTGASFDTSTGEFSWTPTSEDAGRHELTVLALDGDLTDEITVTINVGYSLTVTQSGRNGNETGEVTISPKQEFYLPNTEVELWAVGDIGYTFYKWENDISSTQNPVMLNMNSNKEINAIFDEQMYTLYPSTIPYDGGTIIDELNQDNYQIGDTLKLTAKPNSSYYFSEWSGYNFSSIDRELEFTLNNDTLISRGDEYIIIEAAFEKLIDGFELEKSWSFGTSATFIGEIISDVPEDVSLNGVYLYDSNGYLDSYTTSSSILNNNLLPALGSVSLSINNLDSTAIYENSGWYIKYDLTYIDTNFNLYFTISGAGVSSPFNISIEATPLN